MLGIDSSIRIYLSSGHTDMRKGINGLCQLSKGLIHKDTFNRRMFIFRGKRSDRIKILWWDGQGFCLYYKCLDRGKFTWPSSVFSGTISITKAQLSMLLEGIDWRTPVWSEPPQYCG